MSSQPNETAAEDIRNALQLLRPSPGRQDCTQTLGVELYRADLNAAVVRLEAALAKLEAPRTFLQHGANRDCPEVQSGQWTRCHGHHLTAEGITLRADGDHIVRSAPLDYVVPGQVDPVLRGQEITEDGE